MKSQHHAARLIVFQVYVYVFLVLVVASSTYGVSSSSVIQAKTLVSGGGFFHIYDPSDFTSWYINDQTFILGPGGMWHMLGITHSDPAAPLYEVNFAHAISPNLTSLSGSSGGGGGGWTKQPFATGSVLPETHMWAPHIIYNEGLYYMYYCGGGASDELYQINLRTSPDLYTWTFKEILFEDGFDGRDPMVMNLGSKFNNTWVMYYCGTTPNSGSPSVHHVTYARTSVDLVSWSHPPVIVFDAGSIGSPYGGPTESPFVVRRGSNFYLFSGSWNGYSDTRVFVSNDPFNFGNTINNTAQQVGEIPSHAPEVVRDVFGKWYLSRAGWGQGGLFLSPLTWYDGVDDHDDNETSMPVPVAQPALKPFFNTSLQAPWSSSISNNSYSQWVQTPAGLKGGYVYGDAFYMSSTNLPSSNNNFIFESDVMLITKDGNPAFPVDKWTRTGSAASIVFRASSQSAPATAGCYVVNIHTDSGGGVKLFKFPYLVLQSYSYNIQQYITYHLKVEVNGSNIVVWFNAPGEQPIAIMKAQDTSYNGGYLGVNVWQGSALFQNVIHSVIS
eukprot:TRINITY_DN6494_c0_g1_i1.p1 TRINITY_DN6494_c0_g1~~TRINITY_DN6494_c0_g1_i1.p1  ORF type:complete len:556 (-),score=95.70 TRINITY_DN6494_c0_g1_i1:22-1689(-)